MSERRLVLVFRPVIALGVLLVAAALAGALYVGARNIGAEPSPSPSPAANFACPPGTDPHLIGPGAAPRPNDAATGLIADANSGRLVVLVGQDETKRPWPSGQWTGVTAWTFDVCTNRWRGSAAAVTGGALAYDAVTDRVLIFGADAVIAYDADADSAVRRSAMPLPSESGFSPMHSWHAAADPASGVVYVRDKSSTRMWTYDPSGDAWTEITQLGDVPGTIQNRTGGVELLAYDTTVRRLVLYTRATVHAWTYEFDPATATWTKQAIRTPLVEFAAGDLGWQGVAYDAAHARTVVFSLGQVIAYEAAAHEWEILYDRAREPADGSDPTLRIDHAMTYDPVNQRVVIVGGHVAGADDWVDGDDVLAFDLDTGTWRTLLAPSGS